MAAFAIIVVTILFSLVQADVKDVQSVDDVQSVKALKNLQFSWSDCTPKLDGVNQGAAVIKSLQVSPDPIVIPGNLSVGFELDAGVNLTSPSPVSLPCY